MSLLDTEDCPSSLVIPRAIRKNLSDDKCLEIIWDSVFYWPHLSGVKCNKTNYPPDLGWLAKTERYDGQNVLLPIWSHHQVLLWWQGPTSILPPSKSAQLRDLIKPRNVNILDRSSTAGSLLSVFAVNLTVCWQLS